jgi:hypothetical protein
MPLPVQTLILSYHTRITARLWVKYLDSSALVTVKENVAASELAVRALGASGNRLVDNLAVGANAEL